MNPGKLAKSYVFWTYQRGSFHYDVMVTAILIFMFGAPFVINFKDRPVETVALHSSEVLVREAGMRGDRSLFLYEVRAEDLQHTATDAQLRTSMLRIIEPVAGEVTIDRWEPQRDATGHIASYKVWVLK